MNHKTVFAATFFAAILFGLNLLSGQHYPGGNYGPPPSGPSQYGPGCDSGCGDAYQPVYSDGGGWHGGGQYDDYGYGYDGCDYGDCGPDFNGRHPGDVNVPPRFRRRAERRARRDDRFGGKGITRGREGNEYGAPFIQGKCGDCNWGPAYLSVFGGVSFIDNFDSRFTFDNGMMGFLGINETGFTTLDGVTAGGSIGRYFYRQARTEFEYTFRDNGIGDMTEFEFSDDLMTPQINDMLVDSTVSGADGNMQSNSFMFNFLVDMAPRTVGCPNAYIGGGIGVLYVDSDIETDIASFNVDDTSFAFQGIVGVNMPFRDRVDLFTEYRYLGADSIRVSRTDATGTESLGAFRFDSHSLVFGLRFLR